MAWQMPTLGEVRRSVRDDVAAELPGADALPPNSNIRVIADANAGLAYLNLLFLEWLARQLLPDTAEAEWLDRHAEIWIGGRKPGTFAGGEVEIFGNLGAVVPAGARLRGAGAEYETLEASIIAQNGGAVVVRALDAGAAANALAGARLTFVSALSGVQAQAIVAEGGLSGGVDEESDESVRERVLFRIRRPPMGGAPHDYVAWARAVPGVSRAWAAPREMGVGTVTVRVMMDELRLLEDGLPRPADLDAVRAYIEDRRPAGMRDLFVVAPILQPVAIAIRRIVPDGLAQRGAVEAALAEMIRRRQAPRQPIHRSWVSEAISAAPGIVYHELDYETQAMPSPGHVPVLGPVTYG